MRCTSCQKESAWLHCIGTDNVCAKCIAKHTLFKEVRFSDESRLAKVLRRRPIGSFDALKAITVKDFDIINAEPDQPTIKKYKEKKKGDIENIDVDVPIE